MITLKSIKDTLSYDIALEVIVDGTNIYAAVAEPELSNPSYFLRDMFVACMAWDYDVGECYPCADVIKKVETGIKQLKCFPQAYDKFNPTNRQENREIAILVLESLRKCINDTASWIPIEHLYMRWGY